MTVWAFTHVEERHEDGVYGGMICVWLRLNGGVWVKGLEVRGMKTAKLSVVDICSFCAGSGIR